jgi:hypothetical protein
MEDPEKGTQEEATAEQATPPSMNDEYGDDALNRAAESEVTKEPAQESAEEVAEKKVEEPEKKEEPAEAAEEVPAEEPAEPPKEDDEAKEEHRERTRLGRKVSKLEEMLAGLAEQNTRLIEALSKSTPQADAEQPQEDQPFEGFATQAELDAYLDRREAKKAETARKKEVKYQTDYLDAINSWTDKAKEDGDPDVAEVYKMLVDESENTQFNVRHSSDPKADFALNLARAQASYYKTKVGKPAEKKNPLKNEPAKAPLGVGGAGKTEPEKTKHTVKLDPAALEFIKATGMDEEKAKAHLSSPTPMHLRRGK